MANFGSLVIMYEYFIQIPHYIKSVKANLVKTFTKKKYIEIFNYLKPIQCNGMHKSMSFEGENKENL